MLILRFERLAAFKAHVGPRGYDKYTHTIIFDSYYWSIDMSALQEAGYTESIRRIDKIAAVPPVHISLWRTEYHGPRTVVQVQPTSWAP